MMLQGASNPNVLKTPSKNDYDELAQVRMPLAQPIRCYVLRLKTRQVLKHARTVRHTHAV